MSTKAIELLEKARAEAVRGMNLTEKSAPWSWSCVLGPIDQALSDLQAQGEKTYTKQEVEAEHRWITVGEDSVDLNEFDRVRDTAREVVDEAEDDALGMYDYVPHVGGVDQHYMLHDVRRVVRDAGILSSYIRSLPSSTGVPSYSMSRDHNALLKRLSDGGIAFGEVGRGRWRFGFRAHRDEQTGMLIIHNTNGGTTSADASPPEPFLNWCGQHDVEWLSPSKEPETHIPKLTFELPQGDNRSVRTWYTERKPDGTYHVCVSIEGDISVPTVEQVIEAAKDAEAQSHGHYEDDDEVWSILRDHLTPLFAPKEPASSPEGATDDE